MSFEDLGNGQQISSLAHSAKSILAGYGIQVAQVENINHGYNSTFAVTAENGERFSLRINVNSGRSAANVSAELFFINALAKVGNFHLALPIANEVGSYFSKFYHHDSGRDLIAVLFKWLDGVDVGDEPSEEVVFQIGSLMARMHDATKSLVLPASAELPVFDDFMWQVEDHLFGPNSRLEAEAKSKISAARLVIEEVIASLSAQGEKQLIHADLHGWNLKINEGALSVFDFDDSGIGLPIQDIATALYYLDTDGQKQAFKEGYASVRDLPKCSEYQMSALLLQRRIHLLNYLYQTTNSEHRELLPTYQAETLRRIDSFLAG